jgi:hypothetical protein
LLLFSIKKLDERHSIFCRSSAHFHSRIRSERWISKIFTISTAIWVRCEFNKLVCYDNYTNQSHI